ncbi:hypothetical protein ACIPPJ_35545, partial [Streptomyces sp. NPDC086091]|uniref:hypothetical protein n=1 Tax=Streptomyces sp. NPDC086091 TaxID=3365751 RepID=UPI00380480DB
MHDGVRGLGSRPTGLAQPVRPVEAVGPGPASRNISDDRRVHRRTGLTDPGHEVQERLVRRI